MTMTEGDRARAHELAAEQEVLDGLMHERDEARRERDEARRELKAQTDLRQALIVFIRALVDGAAAALRVLDPPQ